jgi:hypothetical protein
MTKIIICLIQYLVLISMQMAVFDDPNDEQYLKGHVKKMIRVKKCEAQKDLKVIEKSKNCSFGTLERF